MYKRFFGGIIGILLIIGFGLLSWYYFDKYSKYRTFTL